MTSVGLWKDSTPSPFLCKFDNIATVPEVLELWKMKCGLTASLKHTFAIRAKFS
jgi:hypothetical protein